MHKITLALVDDHKIFIDGLKSVLQTHDFDIVFVAYRVTDAFEKLEIIMPDLIISDISMPEINGIEFVKKVKKLYPKVKVLILSTYKELFSDESIDGFLTKNTSIDILVKAINTIVLEQKKFFSSEVKLIKDEIVFQTKILSTREKEIIKLIADEKSTDEIAKILFISKHTVVAHKRTIFHKLQVNNLSGLIQKAMMLGVLG